MTTQPKERATEVEELKEHIATRFQEVADALAPQLSERFLAAIADLCTERGELLQEDVAVRTAFEAQRELLPARARTLALESDVLRVAGDTEAAESKKLESEQAAAGLGRMEHRRREIYARIEEIDAQVRRMAFTAMESFEAEAEPDGSVRVQK